MEKWRSSAARGSAERSAAPYSGGLRGVVVGQAATAAAGTRGRRTGPRPQPPLPPPPRGRRRGCAAAADVVLFLRRAHLEDDAEAGEGAAGAVCEGDGAED